MFFVCTNNVKTMENLYNQLTETALVGFFVYKHNVQTIQNVYKC